MHTSRHKRKRDSSVNIQPISINKKELLLRVCVFRIDFSKCLKCPPEAIKHGHKGCYLFQKRNIHNFWKGTHLTFLTITSKQIKLRTRSKSQIVGNSIAIPNLMWFFKIGWDLAEIWPPESDLFLFPWSYANSIGKTVKCHGKKCVK